MPEHDKLRTFFMEEHLARIRLERLNMGESGARALTVSDLLQGAGLSPAAISAAVLELNLRDSPNWGRDDLRDAVARVHPGAQRENVLITTGTSEALLLLFRHLRSRKTALAMPAFQILYELPRSFGSEIVPLPVRWSATGVPSADPKEWLAVLERERPDCILLNSPHNPSGLVLDAQLCESLLAYAAANGATVIADEHYRFHASDDSLLGPTLYRAKARVFVTGSFIKCLGCCGLRLGWCVGPHEDLAQMQNEKNYTTHTVNPFSEWVAYEVMRQVDTPVLSQMRTEWRTNRRRLSEFLASSRHFVGCAPSGGFVMCVGVKRARSQRDIEALSARLAEEQVYLLPLESMEVGVSASADASCIERGLGFRMGLGLAPQDFSEALDRMERAATRLFPT